MLHESIQSAVSSFLSRLNNTLKAGFIQSVVLYGSAMSDNFIPSESDVDLMIVVRSESGHVDVYQLQKLYKIHQAFVEEVRFPLSVYVYGEDEIPTNHTIGYSLLRTLFIFDYKKDAMILYGRNVIKDVPEPHMQRAAVQLVNDFKRGLRVALANSPHLSNSTELRRLTGDRAGNTVHVTQDICEEIDDLLRWASYSAIMAAKCALVYEGEIITGKNNIGRV